MKLRRYTTQELRDKISDVFFKYMIDVGVEEKHTEYIEIINEYERAIEMFAMGVRNPDFRESTRESMAKQLQYAEQGLNLLRNSNMEKQKEIYRRTGAVDFSRTIIKIPLNKRINAFYDDIFAEVAFYDDVCTSEGKYSIYKELESEDEQYEFLLRNIEITNISLVYESNGRRIAMIDVLGDLNWSDERLPSNVTFLNEKFSDFENLTLKDTSSISNNDLKQWLQSKIDLDKENMTELSKTFIRGDYYSIHQPKDSDDLYIRYVCRSTGRVYYDLLSLRNLQISKYFEQGNYESYSKAWWNLTHLGSKVEGNPIIAC